MQKKWNLATAQIVFQYNYCIAGSWAGWGAQAWALGAQGKQALGAGRAGAGRRVSGRRALGRFTRRQTNARGARQGRAAGARGRGARQGRAAGARGRGARQGRAAGERGRGARQGRAAGARGMSGRRAGTRAATRPRGCYDTASMRAVRAAMHGLGAPGVLAGPVGGSCSQFGFLTWAFDSVVFLSRRLDLVPEHCS